MALSSGGAEAGPSSAPAAQANMLSYRELHDILESSSSTTSTADISKQLHARLARLTACNKPPSGPTPASRSKVMSPAAFSTPDGSTIRLDALQQELCLNFSEAHHTDEVEAATVLRLFLDSQDTDLDALARHASDDAMAGLPKRPRRAKPSSRPHVDVMTAFMDALTAFYLEERLSVLRCVSALLRLADDSYSNLHDVANDVLSNFADEAFGLGCLARFQQLAAESLDDGIRENTSQSVLWATHNLREQVALLEVVTLLYYSRLDPSASFVSSLLAAIRQTDFGRKQAGAGFLDSEGAGIIDCVSGLLLLLTIESLDLERVMDGFDFFSPPPKGSLLDASHVFADAVDYIKSTTAADTVRAPLMLAWSFWLSRVDQAIAEWKAARPTEHVPRHLSAIESAALKPAPAAALKKKGRGERDERNDFDDDEEESPSWPNFVSAALSPGMDLFGTMLAVSRSPLFVSDSPIASLVSLPVSTSLALRAILKGFVLSITELVRPEFVLDFNGLVDLWQATFGGATQDGAGGAELCAQFWEVDFEFAQRRAVLDTATRRWPVSFRPLLGLCKALSGASITSPTSSSSQSDAVLRAAMPVMRYLCEIESLAHVMPPTPSLAPPYEPWEEPGSPNAYKAIRPIPVFGQHLIIPAGTVGRMVSEADGAPVVVVWDVSGLGISAWRLMRDVLANFVGLLPGQAPPRASTDDSRTGDGAVFAERHAPASFATLSPDDAGAHDAEAAANAMDLFSSILAAGPQLSALLLAHLEGDDASGLAEVQDPSIDDKPSLLNIALKVLDQALLAPATASRVIVSAYRLITLALASRPSDIWVAMRSSSALIGSSGLLPYSVRGAGASSSSYLLADEVSRGQFDGLNAVLDLHQSLLEDLQRTQFSISAEACQLKVDVMLRAARWICQAVWMEYQGWKYVKLRQRIEIGRKCVHFFNTILRDGCMCNAAESPAHRLSEAIEQTFVSHVSPLHLGPLVATLSQGQQLIDQLQKAIRQVEAEQARRLMQSCLGFAFAIVERRRLLNAESLTPTLGLFELMVFDHATVATRSVTIASRRSNRVELATAVVGYILLPFSRPLSIEAVRLLTSVCRSTAEVAAASSGGKGTTSSPPTLVGHLGSLQDVEASMAGLVDVVASQERDDELRRETWTLLAAIVDTQPSLATLLLTGRHLASDVERNMANSSSSGKNKAEERPATMARTAIDVAVEHLQNWERSWDSSPAVLEAVLRFLGVAWAHAAEHRSDFARLRSNKSIWKSLGDIAVKDCGQVPDRPEQWEVLEAEEGEQAQEQSDEHVAVQRYAHRTLCSARALTLLAADIELGPSMARADTDAKERQEESLETILSILSDGNLLQRSLVAAFDVQGDVAMHAEFQARLSATFPEVNLDDFRYSARHDDFDLSRRYGDGYCFDMGAFRLRLQGFLPSIEEQSEEMALDERSGLDNESLKQACLLVAAINLDWSIIDARTTYMRAWTRLLESVSEPYVSRSSDSRREDRLKQVQTTCLKAWTRCAAATADEEANGDVIMGIHSERVNLLSVLLELCWGSFSAREDGHQEPQKDFEPVVEAVEQSCRLVGHGVLRVEESLRSGGPGFHRGVFRIVLLCTRRSRSLLKQRAGVRLGSGEGKLKDQGGEDAHLHQRLHQSADLYTSQTITCLRVAIDNAWAALSSVERLQGYQSGERQVSEVVRASPLVEAAEDDLRLLMATMELLLRDDVGIPPHTWAPKMQTTGLLPAAVELFARAPLTMSSTTSTTALMTKMNSNGGDSRSDLSNTELLAAGACPVFGFTLLGFFLAMASSPNTAESLALAGITNALCANALSNLFDQSSPLEEQKPATATIPPLLNSGYENPTHTLWLQMLRVVLGLTHNLGLGNDRYYAGTTSLATVARFVEMELRGFLQVYWIQIERSVLQFSPLGAAASGSSLRRFNAAPLEDFATPSVAPTALTLGQLDEMEEVVGLFLAVARVFSGPLASSASTSVEGKLLDLFVKRATSSTPMLQQLVYLVQHPRELASLLGASVDNSGWTREDEAGCVEQIARIAGQIVKIVWEWTGSVEVLWTEEEEWSLDSLVLSPTISTVPTSSASMGTLLDLAQFLSEKLRSLTTSDEAGGKDKAEDPKTEVGESLEQTLALAATQLAIAVHGRPSPTTNGQTAIQDDTTAQPSAPPREIETGLARDLETCIESCRAALRAAGGAKKASMFLDIVADFGKRVLASS